MSKLITYQTKDGDTKIQSIKLENVKLSYPFLINPRPQGSMGEGTYGTDFLIYDKETVDLLTTYFNQAVQDGLEGWGGQLPKKFNKPFKKPNPEENPNEEGALLILKTKTWTNRTTGEPQPPELFIRNEGESKPHALTEQEAEDFAITAGNIVEAFVVIHPYTFQGTGGVSAKVNAVCKTAEGTPFSTRPKINFASEFSDDTGFEVEEEEKAQVKQAKRKVVSLLDDEDEAGEAVDFSNLVKTPAKETKSTKATTSAKKMTIESLLD